MVACVGKSVIFGPGLARGVASYTPEPIWISTDHAVTDGGGKNFWILYVL